MDSIQMQPSATDDAVFSAPINVSTTPPLTSTKRMPEVPVIPAPANTMDDNDNANLASVVDVLQEKPVSAHFGQPQTQTEQIPTGSLNAGPVGDTLPEQYAPRRSPRGHNSKQVTAKRAPRKSQRSGNSRDLLGVIDSSSPFPISRRKALILFGGRRRRGYSIGGKAPRTDVQKLHE